jgi:ribosomal protein S6E (S10)
MVGLPMMHPNDRREMLVSGHSGSKQHKGGTSKRQKMRNKHLRKRATLLAQKMALNAQIQGQGGMTDD